MLFTPGMSDPPEFAEEYTRAEKVRLLAIYLGIAAVVVFAGEQWLFPAIPDWVAAAPCRDLLGFPGVDVLAYGLFVGIPLSAALLVGLTVSRRGSRIIRDERMPPVGEKVFRRTRVRRGATAKRLGYLHLLAPLPFLAIAAWGVPQAGALSAQLEGASERCVDGSVPSSTSMIPYHSIFLRTRNQYAAQGALRVE